MSAAQDEKAKLLEKLALQVGCAYLSDLHAPQWAAQLLEALRATPAGAAELEEWKEAAQYITGEQKSFDSSQGALEFLVQYLEKEADA